MSNDSSIIYNYFGNMPELGQVYYIPNFEQDWSICRKWGQDDPSICWGYWYKGLVCKNNKEAHELKAKMLEVSEAWRRNTPHKKFNNKQS